MVVNTLICVEYFLMLPLTDEELSEISPHIPYDLSPPSTFIFSN